MESQKNYFARYVNSRNHAVVGEISELADSQQLELLLQHAVDAALSIYRAEYGFVALVNADGTFSFQARRSVHNRSLEGLEEQVCGTIFDRVISDREPLIISNEDFDPDFHEPDKIKLNTVRSIMVVPLFHEDVVFGAICIERHAKKLAFSKNDLAPVECLSRLITASMTRLNESQTTRDQLNQCTNELEEAIKLYQTKDAQLKQLERQLDNLTQTDPLTNVFSRGYFLQQAESILERSISGAKDLSLLAVDVDRLKAINSRHGYRVGDELLRAIADELSHCIRGDDIVGRCGDDEFVLLLSGASVDKAVQIAARLQQRVEGRVVASAEGPVQATVSIGVADCTHGVARIDELMDYADQALVTSKEAGGSRVAMC